MQNPVDKVHATELVGAVFVCLLPYSDRFGVLEYSGKTVRSIMEKLKNLRSNFAVTGLNFYGSYQG